MNQGLLLAFGAGFSLGGSLIVAIGAQNAFVLKQGLRRSHVLAIAMVCALSDAALIWLGAYGLSLLTEKITAFATIARYGGAAFLVTYGVLSARRALSRQALEATGAAEASLARALAICLGFTWMNPHVYLDTVVLIGSIASQYQADARICFCLGATTASFVWFFGLGYGARLLSPLFARPIAWRILDVLIACIMLTLGVQIALGA